MHGCQAQEPTLNWLESAASRYGCFQVLTQSRVSELSVLGQIQAGCRIQTVGLHSGSAEKAIVLQCLVLQYQKGLDI